MTTASRFSTVALLLLVAVLAATLWWPSDRPTETASIAARVPDPQTAQQDADLGELRTERNATANGETGHALSPTLPAEEPTAVPGSLEGQLCLADGTPPDRFEWTVRLEGPGRRWPMDAVPLAGEGRFRAEDLQPGTYRVVVEQDGLTLARVENLTVRAGECTRDPRLLPLEPESLCHEMLVVVRGQVGQRGDLNVVTIGADGGIGSYARWVDAGRLLRAPLGEYPEVVVTAPGYAPQRLPWQDGTVEVTLEPGIEVTLRPKLPVQLPDGVSAWLALRPVEPLLGLAPQGFDTVFPVARLVDPGEVQVRLPAAGRYELRLASTDRQGPGFLPLYETVLGTVVLTAGTRAPVLLLDLPSPIPVLDRK